MNRNLGARVYIRGAPETITKLGNMRAAPKKALRNAAVERSRVTTALFKSEMGAAYTSPWAHNQVGRSIKAKIRNEATGVSIQFTADGGDRDHIRYITGILPDSYFRRFPVAPFPIVPVMAKLLKIRQPGNVRKFIQNPETGRMEGSKGGPILRKKVLWGNKTGGFDRDVIKEVFQSEGAAFVADVQAAVAASLAQSTK